MRWQFVLRLALILVGGCAARNSQRPHVILIVADDLGWNDVGFHGSKQIPTPNIDRLASEGIRLNNYYVQPICTPTRGALLTGRHPMQLGLQRSVIIGSYPYGLGLEEKILPEYLRDVGYSTHIVGKWHLGMYAWPYTPLYRGFESHYGYYLGAETYYDHLAYEHSQLAKGYDFRDNFDVNRKDNGTYSTELFTSRAQSIIESHDTEKPLFLYLPYQAVHSGYPFEGHQPLEAPQRYLDMFPHIQDPNRKLFAGMVAALDDGIGNVTASLEKKGMLNNSILIFTTDNGGPARGFDWNHANNWPLRGGKNTYWDGGMRGSAFVRSPLLTGSKPGRLSNQLMHVTDWLPTILTGVKRSYRGERSEGIREGKPLYGVDMWDSLANDEPSPRHEIIHNYDKGDGALRSDDWKLMVLTNGGNTAVYSDWYRPESMPDSQLNSTTVHCPVPADPSLPPCNVTIGLCLFNIRTDPCEFNNLVHKYANVTRELYSMFKTKYMSGFGVPPKNQPNDKAGLPKYHDGVWEPWRTS